MIRVKVSERSGPGFEASLNRVEGKPSPDALIKE
jgi:hypothetical protein